MSHATMSTDECQQRSQMQMDLFTNTISLLHSQIASINDKLGSQDKKRAPTAPPPIVSHRGLGSMPPLATPAPRAGDPASYDQSPGEWAAGLMKVMREERNCGMASNVYGQFVDDIEKTESAQSSVIIGEPRPLPSPAPPDNLTADQAEGAHCGKSLQLLLRHWRRLTHARRST